MRAQALLWARYVDAAPQPRERGCRGVIITAVDTAKPVVTKFRMRRRATALDVPIAIKATDRVGVTGYLLTEVKSPAPTPTDPGWSVAPPAGFTFSSAGRKTLFAWAVDAAGNVSRPKKRVVKITLP